MTDRLRRLLNGYSVRPVTTTRDLPQGFLQRKKAVAHAYLQHSDPILQSGFSGGAERWRAEREPVLAAVDADGSLIDIGCANGYLLECLGSWARERGIALQLHGLEQSEDLAELARQRLGDRATIHVGNAWNWSPPHRYRYVYTMNDVVPPDFLSEYLHRLVTESALPDGRVTIGAYGSRSRRERPFDVEGALIAAGSRVAGTAWGGDPPLSFFAWVDVARAV